jgi:O-antigen ligase
MKGVALNGSRDLRGWGLMDWALVLGYCLAFLVCLEMNWSGGTEGPSAEAFGEAVREGSVPRRVALLMLAGMACAFAWRAHGLSIQGSRLVAFFWTSYLVCALASILWSSDPGLTARRVLVLLILAGAAAALILRLGLEGLLVVMLLVGWVVISGGLFVSASSGAFRRLDWRFGGVVHPVNQGWHCAMTAMACLGFARMRPHNRSIWIGLAGVAFVFLILTRTRSVLAATVIAATMFGILSLRARPVTVLLMTGSGVAAAVLAVSLLFASVPPDNALVFDALNQVVSLGREDAAREVLTLTSRTPLWDYLLDEVADRPMLGHGYNSYFSPDRVVGISTAASWGATSAHSLYLEVALGLGACGIALVLGTLLVSLFVAVRDWVGTVDGALGASLVAWVLFVGVFEAAIATDPLLPTFCWMAIVAAMAIESTSFTQTGNAAMRAVREQRA